MVIYKCANIKYPDETMIALVFNRMLRISTTNALYLTAAITTANWTWTDATTSKNVNIAAGAANYIFDFKYTLAMPAVSGKYSIAVTFNYYSDAARTVLISTDYHTFELHFYHSADFSTHKYDHAGFDGTLVPDNNLISIVTSGFTVSYGAAIIEGTGALIIYGSPSAVGNVAITAIGAARFFIVAYNYRTGANTFQFRVNGSNQGVAYDAAVRKAVFYFETAGRIDLWHGQTTAGYSNIDGLYVFNPIP